MEIVITFVEAIVSVIAANAIWTVIVWLAKWLKSIFRRRDEFDY